MFRSLTPNSPLKKLSSPPFSFFLQKVHPLSLKLLPCFFIQNTRAAMASKIAPPTPTTTPTIILFVSLNPPEEFELEVSDDAEGCELDIVMIDVWVTTMVWPLVTESKVVSTSEDAAAKLELLLFPSLVDEELAEVEGDEV